jgi:starch synthase
VNFLKGGILYADAVTTVSERYARDIQTPEYGAGLEAVMRENAWKLKGVLNGVDYTKWNPAADGMIAKRYDAKSPAGKQACREALLAETGLDANPRGPIFSMVTRLAEQKGFDILNPLLDRLLADDVRLVILGEGDAEYTRDLLGAAKRNPGRMAFRRGMDDALAHRIYAGSDVMLIPSHFEPCGLNAMYALKYGTLPIARAVGGLHQILTDYDPASGAGNAFLFYEYGAEGLWDSIGRAKRLFAEAASWQPLTRQAMECDFSWSSAAEEYEQLYQNLIGPRAAA